VLCWSPAAMLVYVACFGDNLNETLVLDILPNTTVGQLKGLILKIRPKIEIGRLLFSGKQLDDNNATLSTERTDRSVDRSPFRLTGLTACLCACLCMCVCVVCALSGEQPHMTCRRSPKFS
jgi:hypothetical protein